jgi:glycosyltransferase involved in cell wall biosynthesis
MSDQTISTLVVDVTPLAISGDPIAHIVRDIVLDLITRHSPSNGNDVQRLELIASGKRVSVSRFIEKAYQLPPDVVSSVSRQVDKWLKKPGSLAAHSRFSWKTPSATAQRTNLAFDPLYLSSMPPAARSLVYVCDMTAVIRPGWQSAGEAALAAAAFEHLYDPSIEIIAASQSVARDLWANFGIPRNRCRHLPLYDRAVSPSLAKYEPLRQILFVGNAAKQMNVDGLIRAFGLSRLAERGFTLRISCTDSLVGNRTEQGHSTPGIPHGENLSHIKRVAATQSAIMLLGPLSEADFQAELANCCGFAYFPFWEEYGLLPLAALKKGIPVVLSDSGVLPEIGGEFARYADPDRPHAIADALRWIADRYDNEATEAQPDQAARARWLTRYTRETHLQSLAQAIGLSHSGTIKSATLVSSRPTET